MSHWTLPPLEYFVMLTDNHSRIHIIPYTLYYVKPPSQTPDNFVIMPHGSLLIGRPLSERPFSFLLVHLLGISLFCLILCLTSLLGLLRFLLTPTRVILCKALIVGFYRLWTLDI